MDAHNVTRGDLAEALTDFYLAVGSATATPRGRSPNRQRWPPCCTPP